MCAIAVCGLLLVLSRGSVQVCLAGAALGEAARDGAPAEAPVGAEKTALTAALTDATPSSDDGSFFDDDDLQAPPGDVSIDAAAPSERVDLPPAEPSDGFRRRLLRPPVS